ncbi:hypothetical protein DM01DRAFT_1380260 [Hesseltinella vesiculosa]|uniref:Zn(2)-C6 fungal-type domain-containing protein n=1 Tax=Hesseltinella vesiculosa TaxID=101127 RepID=A0A1X2GTL0_9FUNG|nr:hypothetical protein DM01DRAFT_1380260 [Hesseltinella vesiculosa]
MENIKQHDPTASPKQKRIKVSRACYTCRVKKIKCDGMNPCMQCKARQRPCSFSKDALTAGPIPSPTNSPTSVPAMANVALKPTPHPSILPPVISITLQRLDTLAQSWPGYEYEQQRLPRPVTFSPSSFLLPTPPPPDAQLDVCVNESHIHQPLVLMYYRHRHPLFPILPKKTFMDWLHKPSAHGFVSPLLLFTIYAHAALLSPSTLADADGFLHQAKTTLDSCLDRPRLSTIIALCLLALYEPASHIQHPHLATHNPSSASIYSSMACRMWLDYLTFHHQQAPLSTTLDLPIVQRVYWCCFCLDRWLSLPIQDGLFFSHPSMTTLPDIKLLEKESLATDPQELLIIDGLRSMISLLQLGERLHWDMLASPPHNTTAVTPLSIDDKAAHVDQCIRYFVKCLPTTLQWTPCPDDKPTVSSPLYQPFPSQPPHHPMVATLHLHLNFIHLSLLLQPLRPDPSPSSSQTSPLASPLDEPAKPWLLQRCVTIATNLTQLGSALIDQPHYILSYSMLSRSLMLATQSHLMYAYPLPPAWYDPEEDQARLAKHTRQLFQRTVRTLRRLLEQRTLPDCADFALTLEKGLANLSLTVFPPSLPAMPQKPGSLPPSMPSLLPQHSTQYLEQSAAEILSNAFTQPDKPTASHPDPSPPLTQITPSQKDHLLQPASTSDSPSVQPSELLNTHHLHHHLHHHEDNLAHHPSMGRHEQRESHLAMPPPPPPPPVVTVKSTSPSFANITTPGTNNPLYHQDQPQLHSHHFAYSFPFGRQDEIWALQEHLQQQEQQQQQPDPHPHLSTASSFTLFTSSLLGYNLSSPTASATTTATLTPSDVTKQKPLHTSSSSSSTTQPTHSTPTLPSSNRSFGLGVYASAHRHHSDVISHHLPGNNKNARPVLLNHHGQVVVTSSQPEAVDLSPL